MTPLADLDHAACYAAVRARDRRFDGVFYTGVRSTGIYCRPSCPARTPAERNVSFHPSAAAAQSAGFRACKRCVPDATPGSPAWDVAGDVAGRAMRLIADGVVDRDGVEGLAGRVGYTSRHLTRVLTAELGAGPLALARARRAQTARVLIENTGLSHAEIAFAAGFGSVRQFNETIREVYDATPSQLRGGTRVPAGEITLRLAVRLPFDASALVAFLRARALTGVETGGADWYARTLALPFGPGVLRWDFAAAATAGFVRLTLRLSDTRDTAAAVERARRLIDADCDPVGVASDLGNLPVIGPLVAARPGLRVPGHVDGAEIAVRAIVGQQVSVAGARTVASRIVQRFGEPFETGIDGLTHLFPTPQALASAQPEELAMPASRARALAAVCAAIGSGQIALDRGSPRAEVRAALLAVRGVGPWTCDYIALRALGDPDVFLAGDVGVRNALRALGSPGDPRAADNLAAAWRPWRSYALMHLWQSLEKENTDVD